MAVLTHELLTLDASGGYTAPSIALFVTRVLSFEFFLPFPNQPLNQIIESLRLARMHKSEMRKVHLGLAKCLSKRYCNIHVNDDYEEAVSILDEIIASSSPEDKSVASCQQIVSALALVRSIAYKTPENSEEAIYRARTSLASSPVKETLQPTLSQILEHVAKKDRFEYFGPVDDLEASSSGSLFSLPVPDDGLKSALDGLLSGIRNNITDIDEAVDKGRTFLASSDPNDLDAPHRCEVFGEMLYEAFDRTNKIEYLNESISTQRQVLPRLSPKYLHIPVFLGLSLSLVIRSQISPGHRTQDLHEAVELLSQCLNDGSEMVGLMLPDRFEFACIWAYLARLIQHPSVSTAFETAMSLIQDTLLFAPTLQLQHTTLSTSLAPHYSRSVPLDYASYQVDLGQLEQAIETLERGRALLWSEMRHLRTSIDQILGADPQLGHKFATVNRDLEELTKSIPPSHNLSMDDDSSDDLRAADPFGRLFLKQRGLLKVRNEIISQIRALPGFGSFLTSPSFDTLRSATSSGPVIIINHSKSRSDILILLHNTSPSLIPTPDDFYIRAIALKDKLLHSRNKDGLDSNRYDQTLSSVLAELYELVGKPVIDRLRQLKVPEQSRIWWCPTSVFCSLPLHAMGPILSDDGEPRYFLDLYICSFTPTLSALIQSRNLDSGSRSSSKPSILLVAQSEPSLPTVGGEIQVVQSLDTEVKSLVSAAATPAAVIDEFQHHHFVHFACHGTLATGKPFEAGFELYRGERLTLLEIVRSDVPTAQFAFLSACHTAEVTDGSTMDEGLHLAAAVQYCGFRSVVGTMWAMVDEDGRDLAEHFYKALFSNSRREEGIPYYERSAKALRFAVKKLRRKKRISLERWVNFVHYGA